MDKRLVTYGELAASKLMIPVRFIVSWWVTENGWEFPVNNNPANISYTGNGLPDRVGVFVGVKEVQPNHVCVYETPVQGIDAFVYLISLALNEKLITLDATELQKAEGNIKKLCEIVGASNWSTGHYQSGNETWQGESIYNTYYCNDMSILFGEIVSQTTPVKLGLRTIDITEQDEINAISRRYLIPVPILERANKNGFILGKPFVVPTPYHVVPGDTLSGIALKFHTTIAELIVINNLTDPNQIRVHQLLYV